MGSTWYIYYGSPDDEANRADDETQRNVSISNGFYLGRFEVSQFEYFKVMNSNTDGLFARPSFDQDDSKPVESVSWNDINSTFLPLLNKLENDNGNLPNGWTYSLTTKQNGNLVVGRTSTSYSYGDSTSTNLANYDGSSTKVIGFIILMHGVFMICMVMSKNRFLIGMEITILLC